MSLIRSIASCLPFITICIIACFAGVHALSAQIRHQPSLPRASHLDEQAVANYLINLRYSSIAETYVFRFRIRHFPPRARTITYYGTMYGTFDPASGHHWERILIQASSMQNATGAEPLRDMLLRRGPYPLAWTVDSETKNGATVVKLLDTEGIHQTILDDITLTYFDLLAPYLYWEEFRYDGPAQVKARPTQSFSMFAPEQSIPTHNRAEIHLDDEFGAILTATMFDQANEMTQSMELIAFRKTSGHYIPRTLDYRDHVNRGHKTRIDILAAALDVELPAELFDARKLNEPFPDISTFVYDVFR